MKTQKITNGCRDHYNQDFHDNCWMCNSWRDLLADTKRLIKKGGLSE